MKYVIDFVVYNRLVRSDFCGRKQERRIGKYDYSAMKLLPSMHDVVFYRSFIPLNFLKF
jgi:hypothetical protein